VCSLLWHVSSYAWKRAYKKRTSVERVNSRLDVFFNFENHTVRGLAKMKVRCGLALCIMLAMAVGQDKTKTARIDAQFDFLGLTGIPNPKAERPASLFVIFKFASNNTGARMLLKIELKSVPRQILLTFCQKGDNAISSIGKSLAFFAGT